MAKEKKKYKNNKIVGNAIFLIGCEKIKSTSYFNIHPPPPHPTLLLHITRTALGDPLIKGLTEVANSRPSNPVKFLADYLHSIADNKKIVISCFYAPFTIDVLIVQLIGVL